MLGAKRVWAICFVRREHLAADINGTDDLHHECPLAGRDRRRYLLHPGRGLQRVQRANEPIVHLFSAGPARHLAESQQWSVGSTVTIAGANFITGSTVGFCAETNGNPTNAQCPTNTSFQSMGTVPATCWQAAGGCSASQMIVSVPTLAAGTYYPVVNLPSQYSGPPLNIPPSQPYNEPADIFTYT